MAKMSFEDCVKMALEKEGGAAGLKAIKEFLEEKGHSSANLAKRLKSVPSVGQHKHGDYVLMGIGMMKKAAKKGEGSRGGNVIGHTRSGKPIYASKNFSEWKKHHGKFTRKDHDDAGRHHEARARAIEEDGSGVEDDDAYDYHAVARRLHENGDTKSDLKKMKDPEYGHSRFHKNHSAAKKFVQGSEKGVRRHARDTVKKSNPIPGLMALMKGSKR